MFNFFSDYSAHHVGNLLLLHLMGNAKRCIERMGLGRLIRRFSHQEVLW